MSKLEKRMKLAKEAVELIKEFRGEEAILGHNPLRAVSIKEDGEIIEVDDEFDGVIEYSLTDISSIFTLEMRGWGLYSAYFKLPTYSLNSVLLNLLKSYSKSASAKLKAS